MIAILLAISMTGPPTENYVIHCRYVAVPFEEGGGTYCTFPNGDNAKQNCEDPTNDGTENCVLGHVPKGPGRTQE
jgi:hypothetical protein